MRLDLAAFLLATLRLCCGLTLNQDPSLRKERQWTDPYDTVSAEKRLCRDLMYKYHSLGINGRPVKNTSQAMRVEFALGLIQMDLDEKSRILTISVWSHYRWRDDYLTWNQSEYDGVDNIKLRSEDIWLPDIMLYNTADTKSPERDVHAIVGYTGQIVWVPHRIYRSSCSVDVSRFPFDSQVRVLMQECDLAFGSWTHHMGEIDLNFVTDPYNQKPPGIDVEIFYAPYKESCGWEITSSTASKAEGDNPILSFKLKMRRKRVFSTYILTMPCIFLASLTLVVFWLPPDRPDRTALGMSIFGSFLVLLLILVEAAPPTANSIPLLGVYYCFNMVIIMLSIILSTVVVNVSRAGDRVQIPTWLKVIAVDYLAKVLCVDTLQFKYNTYRMCSQQSTVVYSAAEQEPTTSPTDADVITDLPNGNQFEMKPTNHHHTSAFTFENQTDSFDTGSQVRLLRQGSSVTSYATRREMTGHAMEQYAAAMTKKISRDSELQKRHSEWQVISTVLDRFFFVTYFILIVVSLVCLFPWPG